MPIIARPRFTLLDRDDVSGENLADLREIAAVAGDGHVAESAGQCFVVELIADATRTGKAARHRGKSDESSARRIIKRPLAGGIASQEQSLRLCVEQCEREIADDAFKRGLAPCDQCLKQDLTIG